MTPWSLSFAPSRALVLERWTDVLSACIDGPVTADVGEESGNPYDGYFRYLTLAGQRGDLRVEMMFTQQLGHVADAHPVTLDILMIRLSGPFAAKLAMWDALREALATIGAVDRTVARSGASIIDDVEAAGHTAFAARLRAETPAPRPVCMVTDEVQGLAMPELVKLYLRRMRRVDQQDLAGAPALEVLSCVDSPLEVLDPTIIDVCPRLTRVMIDDTPLARDAAQLAALQARWQGIKWGTW